MAILVATKKPKVLLTDTFPYLKGKRKEERGLSREKWPGSALPKMRLPQESFLVCPMNDRATRSSLTDITDPVRKFYRRFNNIVSVFGKCSNEVSACVISR